MGSVLACAVALGGCGSISEHLAERASDLPAVGLPTGTPERPATPVVYPAVHDMPPSRPAVLLSEDEQRRVEDGLMADRARNQRAGGQPVTPAPERKPDPAPARPGASSGRSIY